MLKITSEYKLAHEFKHSLKIIYSHLKKSPDPDQAFLYFYDFLVNSTAKSTIFELLISFGAVGEILFGLLSQSETLSLFLINNPEYFFWLIENETLSNKKTKEEYYKEVKNLVDSTTNLDKKEYLIRHYRKREYLRIATREIINACHFTEVMEELSNLADALIEISLELAYIRLKKEPTKSGFCVIGLGKLGNRELNFSSDIDLMFVHGDEDKGEFYNKLASQLVSILSTNKEGGFVFRVDTRLRPGGKSYPLSLNLLEYENYYYTFGQPWERLSLVKARCVAGDSRLGEDFMKLIEPFVYPKSVDIEYIKEIRSLMFKIHKSYQSKNCLLPSDIQDLKKGRGGIREIEFIVNYFQLLFGGKYKELKHVSTIEGLKLLFEKGFLKEALELKDIYLFYRRIEHKLQLKQEKQTQLLPCEENEIAFLAATVGLSLGDFVEKYVNYTTFVHSVFKSIFVRDEGLPIFSSPEEIRDFLDEAGVNDGRLISKLIVDTAKKVIAGGTKKDTIQYVFDYAYRLTKDLGLFGRVVEGLNKVDPTYLDVIVKHERLLTLFLKFLAFGYGERFARNAILMDSLISPGRLIVEKLSKEEKERLEFEMALRILSGHYNHEDLKITTEFAHRFINETCNKHDINRTIAVVGYGKLATYELFKGSDLDLVFVCCEDPFAAQMVVVEIIRELKRLYDVDLRLRPFGEKGSLVVDLEYLKKYFHKDASSWEKQAAQRSRVIYSGFGVVEIENVYREFVLKNPPGKKEIWEMFNKIEKNKAKGFDIKSSAGCITNIDFLAQAVCFDSKCIEYSLGTVDLLRKIKQYKLINADGLIDAYLFYFKILNTLRIAGFGTGVGEREVSILEFALGEKGLMDKLNYYRNFVIEQNKRVFV